MPDSSMQILIRRKEEVGCDWCNGIGEVSVGKHEYGCAECNEAGTGLHWIYYWVDDLCVEDEDLDEMEGYRLPAFDERVM